MAGGLLLTENDIKEELSYAYVHAIASRAGFGCYRPTKDRDSVDVTVEARGKLSPESILASPKIDLQLKATCCSAPAGGEFSFALPMKNYNDLRQLTMAPRLLVVFTMPEDSGEWLLHSEDELIARRCAYWCNLKRMPDVTNKATKTISVQRRNQLSPDSLRALMTIASRQEEIGEVL